jgi:hypothetical protein
MERHSSSKSSSSEESSSDIQKSYTDSSDINFGSNSKSSKSKGEGGPRNGENPNTILKKLKHSQDGEGKDQIESSVPF